MRLPLALLLVALVVPSASASRVRAVRTPSSPQVLSPVSRVFVVVLENTDAEAALSQPFMQRLTREGALLRNYHGVAHPSQANYIAMTSGSTHGVSGDGEISLDVRHLGDLVEERGLNWKAYVENYPGFCNLSLAGDNSGLYAKRHVPFLYYTNVYRNFERCSAHVLNSNDLYADVANDALPAYSLYIPNDRNNGHDTSVAFADQWLESTFGPLLRDPKFAERTLFVVTYDENASWVGNQIATVLVGPNVRAGAVSDRRYDHYSLLRSIEEILGTGTLGLLDAAAQPIDDVMLIREPTVAPSTLETSVVR